MSYANKMFSSLVNFNFYEFFQGGENVFYFMPGLRYFFTITKIFFGDTNFGYVFIGYFLSNSYFFNIKILFRFKIFNNYFISYIYH